MDVGQVDFNILSNERNAKIYELLVLFLYGDKYTIINLSEKLNEDTKKILLFISEINSFLEIRGLGLIDFNTANKFSYKSNKPTSQSKEEILSLFSSYITHNIEKENLEFDFDIKISKQQIKLLVKLILSSDVTISFLYNSFKYDNFQSIINDLESINMFLKQYNFGEIKYRDNSRVNYEFSFDQLNLLIEDFAKTRDFPFELIEDSYDYNLILSLVNQGEITIVDAKLIMDITNDLVYKRIYKLKCLLSLLCKTNLIVSNAKISLEDYENIQLIYNHINIYADKANVNIKRNDITQRIEEKVDSNNDIEQIEINENLSEDFDSEILELLGYMFK